MLVICYVGLCLVLPGLLLFVLSLVMLAFLEC